MKGELSPLAKTVLRTIANVNLAGGEDRARVGFTCCQTDDAVRMMYAKELDEAAEISAPKLMRTYRYTVTGTLSKLILDGYVTVVPRQLPSKRRRKTKRHVFYSVTTLGWSTLDEEETK